MGLLEKELSKHVRALLRGRQLAAVLGAEIRPAAYLARKARKGRLSPRTRKYRDATKFIKEPSNDPESHQKVKSSLNRRA